MSAELAPKSLYKLGRNEVFEDWCDLKKWVGGAGSGWLLELLTELTNKLFGVAGSLQTINAN